MEITEAHLEWASVHRMRHMLDEAHPEFKVTHTYALFTTILCWVMQRIRTGDNGDIDGRARNVLIALRQEPITNTPWSIWTHGDPPNIGPDTIRIGGPFEDFRGFCAERFLKVLRDATAHGDARKIKPVNRRNLLIGHEFQCEERRNGQITWRGTIGLSGVDMRRIGIALADRFCVALANRSDHNHLGEFRIDAMRIHEDDAA